MTAALNIFIPLLTAHLLTDFVLQSDRSVRNKRNPLYFLLHILIAGLTSYLLLGQFLNWMIPVAVLFSHAVIDLLKLSLSPRWLSELTAFTIDQITHLASIFAIAYYATPHLDPQTPWWISADHPSLYLKALLLIAGFIASTSMASIIIKKILPHMLHSDSLLTPKQNGLPQGGHYIGYLERTLLFTFVMAGQLPAAGFLVAAKSIFRFNDIKGDQQEKSEYILVGTLLSFTTGILCSIAFQQLWTLLP